MARWLIRPMYDLCLIGIGTGNPDHLTREGAKAIQNADLILIPRKGGDKSDLAELRLEIIAGVCGDTAPDIAFFDIPQRRDERGYLPSVDAWHAEIAKRWQAAIAEAPTCQQVALLVWGDPSLYDSSLRIAARLAPKPKIRVIPGITALQALTAAHGVPLNDIGAPVLVTTGRRLRNEGWPDGIEALAVMLDGACSFQSLEMDGVDIWWGAYLGMKEQRLISGALNDVSARIIQLRAEARKDHGWIMDIYLLKKPTNRDANA